MLENLEKTKRIGELKSKLLDLKATISASRDTEIVYREEDSLFMKEKISALINRFHDLTESIIDDLINFIETNQDELTLDTVDSLDSSLVASITFDFYTHKNVHPDKHERSLMTLQRNNELRRKVLQIAKEFFDTQISNQALQIESGDYQELFEFSMFQVSDDDDAMAQVIEDFKNTCCKLGIKNFALTNTILFTFLKGMKNIVESGTRDTARDLYINIFAKFCFIFNTVINFNSTSTSES